jgi:hypothetical protein
MINIREVALQKALTFLKASGANYHIQYEGAEYGAPIAPPKPAPKAKGIRGKTRHFGITAYVRPYLEELEPDDVARIPTTKQYPSHAITGVANNVAKQNWGVGSYITAHINNAIEVLRVS